MKRQGKHSSFLPLYPLGCLAFQTVVEKLMEARMKTSRLLNCIAKAANFLDENQIYNGGFRCYLANNEALQGRNALVDSCPFYTSCILYSLSFLDDPKLTTLKRTATEFLIKDMMPPSVWKYFSTATQPLSIPIWMTRRVRLFF